MFVNVYLDFSKTNDLFFLLIKLLTSCWTYCYAYYKL